MIHCTSVKFDSSKEHFILISANHMGFRSLNLLKADGVLSAIILLSYTHMSAF